MRKTVSAAIVALVIVLLISAVRPLYRIVLNSHPAAQTNPSLAAYEVNIVFAIGMAVIVVLVALAVMRKPILGFLREAGLNLSATALRRWRRTKSAAGKIASEIDRRSAS